VPGRSFGERGKKREPSEKGRRKKNGQAARKAGLALGDKRDRIGHHQRGGIKGPGDRLRGGRWVKNAASVRSCGTGNFAVGGWHRAGRPVAGGFANGPHTRLGHGPEETRGNPSDGLQAPGPRCAVIACLRGFGNQREWLTRPQGGDRRPYDIDPYSRLPSCKHAEVAG